MKESIFRLLHPKNILFLAALFLLLALGLHALEFYHGHPREIFGDATAAYMHGGDKKLWLLLYMAFVNSILVLGVRSFINRDKKNGVLGSSLGAVFLVLDFSKLYDPIRLALREGRLQRKICC